MSRAREDITGAVERFYTTTLSEFGPTPRGVNWRDGVSQHQRFDVVLRVLGDRQSVNLLDFGCGYGALLDHPAIARQCATYVGLDISHEMIEMAQRSHRSCGVLHPTHSFMVADGIIEQHQFIVASGVFNVKLATSDAAWKEYIWDTVRMIADQTAEAFAYNCLSRRSDPAKRRNDLHYADHLEHVSFLRQLGFGAEVVDDYGLHEFTIIARR